ncbi:MAG: glycosyltransferase [Candidatus Nezhaarchaeales archaeon]
MSRGKVLITNLVTAAGGGTRTTLSIVRCLADAGYLTHLVSLWGLDVKTLEKLHGIQLGDLISKGVLRIYYRPRRGVLTSMRYFSCRDFKNLVNELIKTGSYNALFFFDDVLKVKELLDLDTTMFLYVHFSFVHRMMASLYDELTGEMQYWGAGILKERLMRVLLSRFFVANPKLIGNVVVLANSTVTRLFIRNLWGVNPLILYPPVIYPSTFMEPSGLFAQKKNLIVSVGVFEPMKRFGVLLDAFARSRVREKAKLVMVGNLVNPAYLRYLREKSIKLGIKDRVKFLVNVDDSVKWDMLIRSKIIVHAKIFEPFGMAVAEGMYAGCIPIVFKGSLSGPWIDIVERGKYGFGFRDTDELTEVLSNVLTDYEELRFMVDSIKEKALSYFYTNFKAKLLQIIRELVI